MELQPARIDPTKFEVRDLPSIWGLDLKPDWLVDRLIPASAVTMLSGESGSGKSSLALALAAAVASGEPFLGLTTQKRPVLIVDRENNLSVYSERFRRFDIPENPDMLFWGHFSPVEPPKPSSLAIKKFAMAEKPLIIYDSFIAFMTGSEQSADEVRKYTDDFRTLAGLGATIIVIHHTGKGENTKEYRGSSDIKASLDAGYVLTVKKPLLKLLKLKSFKCREGNPEDFLIALEGSKFVTLDTQYIQAEDKDWALVMDAVKAAPGSNQNHLMHSLPGISPMKIRKILMACELKGTLEVQKGPKHASLYFMGVEKDAQ